ncbi:C-C motif chemokine 13-like [Astyanax mexicanus]|uniref:C-C motif chemokine 13-like n=1 Tax=Astyanax mexicanus TaxID=7994 RepID=A0A8T2LQW7_ASTMX|nr:C-C motif chemokine 13-like [Astyanax mexicanus]
MRSVSALLLVLLLCSVMMTCRGTEGSNRMNVCCEGLQTFKRSAKIPLGCIKSYTRTSGKCTIKAVVFHTVNGKQVCVDAMADWVIDRMEGVDAGLNLINNKNCLNNLKARRAKAVDVKSC